MMILHTKYLKDYSPDSITKSVRVWDESVKAMWKIMGFDKYPQPHNNRQLGVSVEGGAICLQPGITAATVLEIREIR